MTPVPPRWLAWLAVLAAAAPSDDARGQALALSHPVMVFTGRVGANPGPQTLTIRTTPSPAATWAIPTTLPGWLAISPSTGTGPGDVVLTVHAAGLSAGVYHVQLTVSSGTDSRNVEVFLVLTDANGGVKLPVGIPFPPLPPAAPPARYLVEFFFVGYSGLVDGYPHCKVNPNGKEHMIGVLSGAEPSEEQEDAEYVGIMSRLTMVDFCDVKPTPGKPDEPKWCEVSLIGGATMRVEFTVYADSGRGGWLKAKQEGTQSWNLLRGTCDAQVTSAIRNAYPGSSDGGGGSPSGQSIQDPAGRLSVQGLARLRLGDYAAVDKHEGQWSMRVLARILP